MKKFYFLFCLVFSFNAIAQIVNIPDANFKAKLLSASVNNGIASVEDVNNGVVNSYNKIDLNNDGEIQVTEAETIKYLAVNYSYINDLTGIEAFVNLQYLDCVGNYFGNLDVSIFIDLEWLNCSQGYLSNLHISNLTNLQVLYCENNYITNLDISGLINLQTFNCSGNQLTSLDISNCKSLDDLRCFSNNLIFLNLKNGNSLWVQLIFNDNISLQYLCADEEDINFIQQEINYYGYSTTCNLNSYCSFTPGGNYYEISGNTILDYDNNGCDVNDVEYPNLNFSITDGTNTGTFIANGTGEYYIPVQAGSHTITPNLQNPSYFNISPASITVDFPSQASPNIQDFCVTPNGVHSDIEITLVPTTPARPGFNASYKLIYKNVGNQVESGAVTFAVNEEHLSDYVLSNPVYNSLNTVNNQTTYTWNYNNLLPFETREIDITLNINAPTETPPVNIDDVLIYIAQITTTNTDEDLSNNSSGLKQTVVGSYDPNDKTCIEGETITPNMVGEYVHYVIRFENTGTYPAENIVVKDMIDETKFDVSTLLPINGSHEFYTRINGNKVEFIFENINLDFNNATNDGYVAFKIKTLPTLVLGDTFTNEANIYFDYNFPITTNTYTTIIEENLGSQDFEFANEFTLYPNPTKDILHITSKNVIDIKLLEIYNIVGQVVLVAPNFTKAIDVSSLKTGNYLIKVRTEKGSAIEKFIKY